MPGVWRNGSGRWNAGRTGIEGSPTSGSRHSSASSSGRSGCTRAVGGRPSGWRAPSVCSGCSSSCTSRSGQVGAARRAADFYARGLARVEGRWPGSGVDGLTYLDLEHPYAADLDLFGRGSLFERLCTARTRTGEEVLASWLLNPADAVTIAERHLAVDELRPRLDLREDLELLGAEVRAGIDPDALAAWCAAPRTCDGWVLPLAAAVLALAGSAALLGWLFFGTDLRPLLIVAVLDLAFSLAISRRLRSPGRRGPAGSRPGAALGATDSPRTRAVRVAAPEEPACGDGGGGYAGLFADPAARPAAQLAGCAPQPVLRPFRGALAVDDVLHDPDRRLARRRRSRGGPMDPGGRRVRGPVPPSVPTPPRTRTTRSRRSALARRNMSRSRSAIR